MSCEAFRDARVLDAYGDLDAPGGDYLNHLGLCAACREEIEEMREVSEEYRSASVDRWSRRFRVPQRRERWIPAAAAAVLVAVLVGGVLRSSGDAPSVVIPRAERPAARPSAPLPLPAWDADDEAFDGEMRDLRRRVQKLESEVRGRNS